MEALVLLAVALAIAGVVVLSTGGSILEKQNGRYNCHDVTGETLLNRGGHARRTCLLDTPVGRSRGAYECASLGLILHTENTLPAS